jgi:hypothetical protein
VPTFSAGSPYAFNSCFVSGSFAGFWRGGRRQGRSAPVVAEQLRRLDQILTDTGNNTHDLFPSHPKFSFASKPMAARQNRYRAQVAPGCDLDLPSMMERNCAFG